MPATASITFVLVLACSSALRVTQNPTNITHEQRIKDSHRRALLGRASVLCSKNYWQTLKTCVERYADATAFVRTGDISGMWIRDSAAQLHPYLPLASDSPEFQSLLEGALRSQAKYIAIDPYANAYYKKWKDHDDERLLRGGFVFTANHEMDSGAYFLRFLKLYTDVVPTSTLLREPQIHEAVTVLMKLYRLEQNHNKSQYKYPLYPPWELPGGPSGNPVGYTGMVWNAFRPSDDPHTYGYHVPGNLFLANGLPFVVKVAKEVWEDQELAEHANKLRDDILNGVQNYGTKEVDGKTIYCYETDGMGNCNLMDDANVPSLLSIPYLDPSGEDYNREVYANTREFVLSDKNPWFFRGSVASGIGSPHTGNNMIWPMSLIMQAFTTESPEEKLELIKTVLNSAKDEFLRESFHKDNKEHTTREWFGWPNALFAELVMRSGSSCGTAKAAPKMPEVKQRPDHPQFYAADVKTLRYRSIPGLGLMKS